MSRSNKKGEVKEFLKKQNSKLNVNEVARRMDISTATASKWINKLEEEGKLLVEEYGNVKVVKWDGESKKGDDGE